MELFGSSAALLNILISPIVIVVYFLRIVSFDKINKRSWIPNLHRTTLDMTFGDMVAWYLTKKYNLRLDVNFKFKAA